MPLTPKGRKIKAAMQKEYGDKKGEGVFYASINSGKVKGAEGSSSRSPEQRRKSAKLGRDRSHARQLSQRLIGRS